MKKIALAVVLIISITPGLRAQGAPDAAELTKLLNEFLDGASRNEAAMHDRFWADDLIYTGSSGRRIGKADIMRDQHSLHASRSGDPSTSYSAEDVRIQQYGNTAIVAFRLVATTKREGKLETSNYLNTGTFLKRDGKWQAVSWQATGVPRSDDESKNAVAVAEASFHRAIFAADTKALERLSDASFVWTRRNGERVSLKRLLDELESGQLKYSKIEAADVTISAYGDAAVVRGVARMQLDSNSGKIDSKQISEHYTMILVNRDGAWKVVSMHSSGV
ncbi:MAG TPA: nuclear transport factor 2 family protein [Blastocatellia bacterium]|nr:nuclear transport factor 2 family protein [Blastocatellia bacterium]